MLFFNDSNATTILPDTEKFLPQLYLRFVLTDYFYLLRFSLDKPLFLTPLTSEPILG